MVFKEDLDYAFLCRRSFLNTMRIIHIIQPMVRSISERGEGSRQCPIASSWSLFLRIKYTSALVDDSGLITLSSDG